MDPNPSTHTYEPKTSFKGPSLQLCFWVFFAKQQQRQHKPKSVVLNVCNKIAIQRFWILFFLLQTTFLAEVLSHTQWEQLKFRMLSLIISPNMLMLRFYSPKMIHPPQTENVVLLLSLENHWSEYKHLMSVSQLKRGTIVTQTLILHNSVLKNISWPLWLDTTISNTPRHLA